MQRNYIAQKVNDIIISFTALFSLIGCSNNETKITDYYTVYDYVDFDYNGDYVQADYVLMCKLGCKGDAFIENVIQIEWNDSLIISETDIGFFIVKGNSYGLCCCCNNDVIGPLSKAEMRRHKANANSEAENLIKIYISD